VSKTSWCSPIGDAISHRRRRHQYICLAVDWLA